MTNTTTMTQQEKPNPIDKKALKRAAKKNLAGTGVSAEKANGADKRREQDIAELRQMIAGASTAEEANEIYEKLGEDLIPEKKFREELVERFRSEASKPEQPTEQPVEAEPAPPATTEVSPQKTLGEELKTAIEEAARATSEEIWAAAPETEPVEEKKEPAPQVRVKVEGQEYPVKAYEEAPEDEATTLLRKVLNGEIAKLDQQLQNPALEQFHEQIFRQIEALRKIESGHDPRYELYQAVANGEIPQESYDKIINIVEPKEKPVTVTGRWKKFILDNMRRLQTERAGARQQKHEEEDRTGAKTRRKQKRERYLESHPEERECLEARDILEEETLEPTPEMEQISAEIKQVESVARQKWQKVISYKMLDATVLGVLSELKLLLGRVEFLRHTLKVAAIQAQTEWQEKKELAKKMLGHHGPEYSHYGRIHIEGKLPEETFGGKLKKALENRISIEEKRAKKAKKSLPTHKPPKRVKQEVPPTIESRPLSVLLKSLRSDIIRGKISPDAFLKKMRRIRELKQQFIRGKITSQQFQAEIQKL